MAEFLRQEGNTGDSKTTSLAVSEVHPDLAQLSSASQHGPLPPPLGESARGVTSHFVFVMKNNPLHTKSINLNSDSVWEGKEF